MSTKHRAHTPRSPSLLALPQPPLRRWVRQTKAGRSAAYAMFAEKAVEKAAAKKKEEVQPKADELRKEQLEKSLAKQPELLAHAKEELGEAQSSLAKASIKFTDGLVEERADTYELLSRMPLGSSLKYSLVYEQSSGLRYRST